MIFKRNNNFFVEATSTRPRFHAKISAHNEFPISACTRDSRFIKDDSLQEEAYLVCVNSHSAVQGDLKQSVANHYGGG